MLVYRCDFITHQPYHWYPLEGAGTEQRPKACLLPVFFGWIPTQWYRDCDSLTMIRIPINKLCSMLVLYKVKIDGLPIPKGRLVVGSKNKPIPLMAEIRLTSWGWSFIPLFTTGLYIQTVLSVPINQYPRCSMGLVLTYQHLGSFFWG